MDYAFETLVVECREGVAFVELNRPEARNAVNLQLCDDLYDFEQRLARDEEVRVVVITGRGPVFCAGADLKERKGKDAAWVRERRRRAFRAYESIEVSEKPHIALVDGALVGSGGEIAMACDFIYASEAASFRFPETLWGTVGATQRLPRRIGTASTKELLFTGRKLEALEALDIGLVQRLFDSESIEAGVAEIATAIANAPTLAISLVKRSVDIGGTTDLTRGIAVERLAIDRCLADTEWTDGLQRFQPGERQE
ncbi:enoyl-CoA hydratase/isomerase family protein [Pelagibius sp.]|uniref:enoyl-CoA hydratase/isomerase family protein n=1 Tax=Pelagibius sp. TaxID=1931238 RepID=UPI003BAEE070